MLWARHDGGYDPVWWYPGGLFLLALVVMVVIALGPRRRRLTRPAALAVGLIVAYTAWSYLSILWADLQGDALDGANRTLIFALAFTLFAILPWEPRGAAFVLIAYALGVTVLGVDTIVRVVSAVDPTPYFIDARLAAPLGYQNATAAMWTFGALVALVLAARRQTPTVLRPILAGCAVLDLELAIMAQSRGWLYALPVVWVLLLAATGQRLRFVAFSIPVGLGVALATGPLLGVYDAGGYFDGDTRGVEEAARAMVTALDDVAGPIAATVALAIVLATALVALDERIEPSESVRRVTRRLSVVATALAVGAVVVAGFVATDGNPAGKVSNAWDEFRTDSAPSGSEGPRLTSFSTGRYDMWRVAVNAWAEHPVGGLGQDNYAREYLVERKFGEEPRWTHSLPLRLLAHTGTVGFLLFAGFLICALWAAWVAHQRMAVRGGRVLIATCMAPLAVWLVHGSIDWLWEYPALSVPALAFLALAGAMRNAAANDEPTVQTRSQRTSETVGAVAGGAAVVLALVALVPPWLSVRAAEGAVDDYRADRYVQALDRLERAADLNRLSAEPYVTEALIALRVGDWDRARDVYERAQTRDGTNWFISFQLGLLASEDGKPREARAHFARARALKRDDPVVDEAFRRATTRDPMSLREGDNALLNRIAERTAR